MNSQDTLRKLILTILNLREFKMWLKGKSDNTYVGFVDDEKYCPLANYANQTLFGAVDNFVVDVDTVYVVNQQNERIIEFDTPQWITFFIEEIDKLSETKRDRINGKVPITAKECLDILEKL